MDWSIELRDYSLLETGSTSLIRNTAAQQLADVQKAHPEELYHLLERVIPYLRSRSWDTRTAAARALEGIASNVPAFYESQFDGQMKEEFAREAEIKREVKLEDPNDYKGPTSSDEQAMSWPLQSSSLDLQRVLEAGVLLAARGDKSSHSTSRGSLAKERLRDQRSTLAFRIGLADQHHVSDPFLDENHHKSTLQASNLEASPITPRGAEDGVKHRSRDSNEDRVEGLSAASGGLAEGGESLSRRQLNALKRKAKASAKDAPNKVRILDGPRPNPREVTLPSRGPGGVSAARSHISATKSSQDEGKIVSEFKGFPVVDRPTYATEAEVEGLIWPFATLCDHFLLDLFDPAWEIRHGAAMGLREIIRLHGSSAGRTQGRTKSEDDEENRAWLDNSACHIICVLALDRFADFGSDRAVAPVRETVAQALGSVVRHVDLRLLRDIQCLLQVMIQQEHRGAGGKSWEVCQGGMLGLKYIVAVRREGFLEDAVLLDRTLESVNEGLSSLDDDVRAASAAVLMPIVQEFVHSRPELIPSVLSKMWDCLENLNDDLSASTGPVMELLANLCTFPVVLDTMRLQASRDLDHQFEALIQRLYPFLRHTLGSVRYSALRALQTLLLSADSAATWITGKTFRLVFQNLVVEREMRTLQLSSEIWELMLRLYDCQERRERLTTSVGSHLEAMVRMTVHPFGLPRHHYPLDPSLLLRPSAGDLDERSPDLGQSRGESNAEGARKRRRKEDRLHTASGQEHNVDMAVIRGDVELLGTEVFFRAKVIAAKALGSLVQHLTIGQVLDSVILGIRNELHSKYYTTRYAASLIAAESAVAEVSASDPVVSHIRASLAVDLDFELPNFYYEFVSVTRTLRAQALNFLRVLKEAGRVPSSKLPTITVTVQGEDNANSSAFSPDQARKLLSEDYKRLLKNLSLADLTASNEIVCSAHSSALAALESCAAFKAEADMRIKSITSYAMIAMVGGPSKPGSLITSLMDSLRKETLGNLQLQSATAIARFVNQLAAAGRRGPVDKIIRNLAKYVCVDTTDTPLLSQDNTQDLMILSLQKDEDVRDNSEYENEVRAAKVTHQGAKEALRAISQELGSNLLSTLPVLEELFAQPLMQAFPDNLPCEPDLRRNDCMPGQQIIDGLSLLRTLVGCLHPELHSVVANLLSSVTRATVSQVAAIRYAAAKCFAYISRAILMEGFTSLIDQILPKMSDNTQLHYRQGAIEVIYHLIQALGDEILPYVIFLVVPVLGRMSDQDEQIRLLATTSFATLVKLIPLEAGIVDPPGFSRAMLEGRERERGFVAQMLDPKKIEAFTLPVAIRAELRPYQQEGVNWLAFLNRYQLHGILCDDMGLGKTLQTLCIIASDHHQRAEEFEKTASAEKRKLPSLIVCPPTLSGHWQQELLTYAPFLSSLAYVGAPSVRERLKAQLSQVDVIITSYEVCRNDAQVLQDLHWNYCVLDEGHLIKNSKSKISLAVKKIRSNHRLILSGTPVQNNVVELWSLFDFLMPGFLGSERIFAERYAKPIAASRFAKSSSREQEVGALAIEALHKQVLPFLLRRLKEEVLEDLPPKIVQNYYCEPSELQKRLFTDFSKSESRAIADDMGKEDKESKQHIFQALQYMRKVCNSPALVLKPGTSKAHEVLRAGYSPEDPAQAPKLGALRDLLVDCGIGTELSQSSAKSMTASMSAGVSQHRALVFCQMREMLDIVQNTVLKTMLPGVQYLRLDGSIEASRRQDIVNTFNADPSYDVLLLTTSVGGLGLNLTGADTVIFIEHDWNPQKDLQAMDRAHRIGQKKVVNVYRLIIKGSIEEKIMNLQRFKMDVAGTVVNQQNIGLGSMQTDELLDLFTVADSATGIDLGAKSATGATGDDGVDITGEVNKGGKKGVLQGLEELWDESQYTEEYNLDSFLAKINDRH